MGLVYKSKFRTPGTKMKKITAMLAIVLGLFFICYSAIKTAELSGDKVTGKKIPFTAIKIAGGLYHSLALKKDGSLWAAGKNDDGQLGTGDNNDHRNTFVKVETNATAMAGGGWYSLALKKDGSLWATGDNSWGNLGTGDNIDRNKFIKVLTG